MKRVLTLLTVLFAFNLSAQQKQYYPQVLIELYSSEGCENCPLADAFVKEIMHIADSVKQPITVLDYHVDIWDRSGWKDPFSDSLYSLRQAVEAAAVKQPAIFTPMIFVNGQGGIPGAAKKEVGFYINQALGQPRMHAVTTTANLYPGQNALSIDYTVEGNIDSIDIHFALVKKEAVSKPTSGENKGKTLEHHNVVRVFQSHLLKAEKGHVDIPLNKEMMATLSQYGLVTFLQRSRGGYVFAVEELMFR